ncbi:MAG: uroporphyrinogen decarboxylase family protein [Candidatus Bathyarchaeia archaeon]
MTPRERFLRCMRFQSVDRPPNFELGYWGQTVERWLQEGMPKEAYPWLTDYDQRGIRVGRRRYEGPLYGHPYFGLDERPCVPLELFALPPFEVKVLEETDRYLLYYDEDGILRKALKEGTVRGTRPSMDTYLDFPVKNREDFVELRKRYDPRDPRRYPEDWPAVVAEYGPHRKVPLCLVPNGTVGFYSLPRRWMGTVGLSKAFFAQPSLVHEMMDFIADFIIEATHKAVHDLQPDYFNFFEDFAYTGGPHISPRVFKEFLLPRYQLVTGFLRKHGVSIIWLDSDGNVEPLLPLLLEAGITCLWPLEAAAGMDPRKVRREYGRSLALSGGIDKREVAKGREAIEREVEAKVPGLIAEGGYIPTLDHSFPPDISYENFLYYLQVKKKALEQA